MTRAKLFEEGPRLPEELSRLLFLEPVLAGRRVLEVGARSGAVARFLLELGAARVVCAAGDRDIAQALRAEHASFVEGQRAEPAAERTGALLDRFAERIDFRVIRPGMLPGDDGAFDLVIDFGLPEALAAGKTFRLTDIARLLSADGFAITALQNAGTHGLAALLPETPARRSGAAPSVVLPAGGNAVTYRSLVEALRLQFDLVQVYFQSLMIGYFFGSYDVEPKDDGLAPQTALMGGEPEPAGHYMFAFGNAVPVIEDVALVQLPFADLLAATTLAQAESTRAVPAPGPAGPVEVPSEDGGTTAASRAAVDQLLEENTRQAQALVDVAARVDKLRGDLEVLVRTVEQRTSERDELARLVEGLEAAVVGRDATVVALRAELERARGAAAEQADEPGPEVAIAARALEENVVLREERARLVEHGARLEQALLDTEVRARQLEEACAQAFARMAELEAAVARLDDDRRRLLAELREAQAAGPATSALPEHAGGEVVDNEDEEEDEDEVRRSETARADAVHGLRQVEELRAQLEEYERELAAAAESLTEERRRHDALFAEVERLRGLALRADSLEHEDHQARAADAAELAALVKRRDELEADAVRLAEGVKALVEEREHHRGRAEAAEAQLAAVTTELARLQAAQEESTEHLTALEVKDEARERRLKAAQTGRDEARREAESSRAALQDVAGQRDTLKHVVAARERDIATLKQELLAATAEVQRLHAQADAQQKVVAEGRQRLSVLEVERTQLKRREEELGRSLLEASARVGVLEQQLRDPRGASDSEAGHTDERVRAMARVALLEASLEEARGALTAERARADLLAAHLDEARAALSLHVARADLASAQLAEARTALERECARTGLAEATLVEARFQLHQERARGDIASSSLDEARARLTVEKARGDLLATQLEEAQAVASAEASRAALLAANLDDARATFRTRRAAWEPEVRAPAGPGPTQAETSSHHVHTDAATSEREALRRRVEELEQALIDKDARLAEQADRIQRLTERIVREAGLS